MARVAARPRADQDLADIFLQLRRGAGVSVTDTYRLQFQASFRRLADHPEGGARRPSLGHDVRIVTVWPYVVLHRYDRARDTVFVLPILHGRRRLALDAP